MTKHLIKILLIVYLLASCSAVDIVKSKPTMDVTVAMPVIEKEQLSPSINYSEKENSVSYGPISQPYKGENTNVENNSIAIGLFLGSGGSRVFAEIELLKEFEKKGIRVSSISGIGLGAVVAAYYAAGTKLSHIEWKLYLFFEKTKGLSLYSQEWLKVAENILLKDFKGKRISSLKYNLMVPLYSTKSRDVYFSYKGDLYQQLFDNLCLTRSVGEDISTIGKKFDLFTFKKQLAIDYLIGMNPLEGNISLSDSSGFLIGNMEKEASLMEIRLEIVDLRVNLPKYNLKMDSSDMMAKYIMKAKKISEMVTLQLKYNIEHLKDNLDL